MKRAKIPNPNQVKRAKIPNFLVVALDEATARFLKGRNTAHYLRKLRSASGSTDNHATSGLKFQILHELLSVGVSVLLSDVDIVVTSNPFLALYRDTDVEGMSDGWEDPNPNPNPNPNRLPWFISQGEGVARNGLSAARDSP